MNTEFTGVFIRKEIFLCSQLTFTQKCLLAIIDNLDNSEKGCFASNKYIAEVMHMNTQTVTNMIAAMRKSGTLQTVYKDGKIRGLRAFVPCSQINQDTLQSISEYTLQSIQYTQESIQHTPESISQYTQESIQDTLQSIQDTPESISIYSTEYPYIIKNNKEDNKEIYSESKKFEPIDDTDWMEVAQAMIEYAKGEGKNQWAFMAGMYNYQEDPDKLISLWCSKAQPYELKNWKKNFRNLTTWIKNEAQNTFRNKQAEVKKEEKPVRDCGYPIYDPKTMKGLRMDCLKMEIDGLPWYVDCDYKPICVVEEWRHRYE